MDRDRGDVEVVVWAVADAAPGTEASVEAVVLKVEVDVEVAVRKVVAGVEVVNEQSKM